MPDELNTGKLYISMYHYTRDLRNSRYPGIKGMDIRAFRKQIEFFCENFNVVRMEQVIDAAKGRALLPSNAVLLTFDDGYIDNYLSVFPILEEFGIQGSFFIPGKLLATNELLDVNKVHYIIASADIKLVVKDIYQYLNTYREKGYDYPSNEDLFHEYAKSNRFDDKETVFVKRILQTVLPEHLRKKISSRLFEKYVDVSEEILARELYMNLEQVRTLHRHGMYIGIHGFDHYWMGNLSREEMQNDVVSALGVMDEFIDKNEWVINYPYGSYNQDVLDFARNNGACLGLTTEVRAADINKDSLLQLPRLDCNDFPPISDNFLKFPMS